MDNGLILMIITIVGAILKFMIIPELRQKKIWFWIEKTVYAIEQIIDEKNAGTEKKDFVRSFIINNLKINISDEELEVLIEAVVYEMNNIKGKVSP